MVTFDTGREVFASLLLPGVTRILRFADLETLEVEKAMGNGVNSH